MILINYIYRGACTSLFKLCYLIRNYIYFIIFRKFFYQRKSLCVNAKFRFGNFCDQLSRTMYEHASRRRYSGFEFHSWEFACSKERRVIRANLILDVSLVPPFPLGAFRRHISALPPSQDIDFIVALVSRCSAVFQYFHQLSLLSTFFLLQHVLSACNNDCGSIPLDKIDTTQRADRK